MPRRVAKEWIDADPPDLAARRCHVPREWQRPAANVKAQALSSLRNDFSDIACYLVLFRKDTFIPILVVLPHLILALLP
jgi:hypothetical protein